MGLDWFGSVLEPTVRDVIGTRFKSMPIGVGNSRVKGQVENCDRQLGVLRHFYESVCAYLQLKTVLLLWPEFRFTNNTPLNQNFSRTVQLCVLLNLRPNGYNF